LPAPSHPTRFASFDATTGEILTCYDSAIHGDAIPPEAIEISEAQFFGHINADPRLKVDVAAVPPVFVNDTPTPLTLEQLKAAANRRVLDWINSLTVQMRAGYGTDEVASWPSKASQARDVIAGGVAGPLITSEAEMTNQTPLEVAQIIVDAAEITEAIIGKVTGLRRVVMTAIDTATDEAEIEAAIASGLATATAEAQAIGLLVPD